MTGETTIQGQDEPIEDDITLLMAMIDEGIVEFYEDRGVNPKTTLFALVRLIADIIFTQPQDRFKPLTGEIMRALASELRSRALADELADIDRKFRQLAGEFGEKLAEECLDIANKLRLVRPRSSLSSAPGT